MAGLDGYLSELPSQERFFWIRCVNYLFFVLGGWVLAMLARKVWGHREGLLDFAIVGLFSPHVCGSLLQYQRHSFCIVVIVVCVDRAFVD